MTYADDVLKARLKTVGVSEYRFHMEAGTESGTEWRIIDVGGSRSQVRLYILFHLSPFFSPLSRIIRLLRILLISSSFPLDIRVKAHHTLAPDFAVPVPLGLLNTSPPACFVFSCSIQCGPLTSLPLAFGLARSCRLVWGNPFRTSA